MRNGACFLAYVYDNGLRSPGPDVVCRLSYDPYGQFFYLTHNEDSGLGVTRYITTDDAKFIGEWAVSVHGDVDLNKLVQEALDSSFVWEAGIFIPYEGSIQKKLFFDVEEAKRYAAGLDNEAGEVYVDPVKVYGDPADLL